MKNFICHAVMVVAVAVGAAVFPECRPTEPAVVWDFTEGLPSGTKLRRGAGYACAENGVCRLKMLANLDDTPGAYRIVCRDLASGRAESVTVP